MLFKRNTFQFLPNSKTFHLYFKLDKHFNDTTVVVVHDIQTEYKVMIISKRKFVNKQ